MKREKILLFGRVAALDLLVPLFSCFGSILILYPEIIGVLKSHILFFGDIWHLGDGNAIFYFDHAAKVLFKQENLFYTKRLLFPDGASITGSYFSCLPLSIIFAPIVYLSGLPLGFNLSIIIILVGNGLGMYILGRIFIKHRFISLLGAVMYTVAPPLIGEIFILQRPMTACWGPAMAGVGLFYLYLKNKSSWQIGFLAGGFLVCIGIIYPFNLVYLSIWILAIWVAAIREDNTKINTIRLFKKLGLMLAIVLITVGLWTIWILRVNSTLVKYQSAYIAENERVLHFPLNVFLAGIDVTRDICNYRLGIPLPLTIGFILSVFLLLCEIKPLLPHIIGGIWALWVALGPRIDLASVKEWCMVSQKAIPAWPWMPHVFMATHIPGFGKMNAQRAIFVLIGIMILVLMKGMARIRRSVSGKNWVLFLAIFTVLFIWWSAPRYSKHYIQWPNYSGISIAQSDKVVLDLPINMKLLPLFLNMLHHPASFNGVYIKDSEFSIEPKSGKNLKLWRENRFLNSLINISKNKPPLLVQTQDLEELTNIGLRHIFLWKGYCSGSYRGDKECDRDYVFLLETLGPPIYMSEELVIFRIT